MKNLHSKRVEKIVVTNSHSKRVWFSVPISEVESLKLEKVRLLQDLSNREVLFKNECSSLQSVLNEKDKKIENLNSQVFSTRFECSLTSSPIVSSVV